ncbi:Sodium:dicarboxylate symporter [Chaetomidium leptoderma]|uniref:Amino acid transporter n=1 Tax=Chaetomidium leptoderma TaxID=669021 RepID=A0AAN6VEH7_9PEZI|nr:Sodium:dicarboxylate symporter [Chaetomidium leptoderma]
MQSAEKTEVVGDDVRRTATSTSSPPPETAEVEPKKPWWNSVRVAGSATQIVIAAALAIAIGLAVSSTVEEIPPAVVTIVAIPGRLWLRALKAVAMILAVQRLRVMTGGGKIIARWTVGYYVATTLLAIVISTILTDLVWGRMMQVVSGDSLAVSEDDAATFDERKEVDIAQVVSQMFDSFIPDNVVKALATDSLLAVLITAIVVGYMLHPGSAIIRVLEEVEVLITRIISGLIKLAPWGVANMALHLFVVLPIIFFATTRTNPYAYWFKCSPAWLTAWGSASSAATLPLTMKAVVARGVPITIAKFSVPLGCLVNMDGTAIYFPLCVVFLAVTQGIKLTPVDYVIICLLSTLASIGTTPIPSSSLVLTVMIAQSVNVPITGMYAIIISIDWFLDRFRTAVNVSGDMYAARILQHITGIKDDLSEMSSEDEEHVVGEVRENSERV